MDPQRGKVRLGLVQLPLFDEDLAQPPADRVVDRPLRSVARRLDPRLFEELLGELEVAPLPRQEPVQRETGPVGEPRGGRVAIDPRTCREIAQRPAGGGSIRLPVLFRCPRPRKKK